MTVHTDLTKALHDAADLVTDARWVRGKEVDGELHCAHGAVMRACDVRLGDAHIIRAVMRSWGLTEAWNDEKAASAADVRAAMLGHKITDTDLEATFGPQVEHVVGLVRRAAVLTVEEVQALNAAGAAARDAAGNAAGDAARNAARDAAWAAARDAAWDAARDAAWDAAWAAARNAAWAAARAAWALVTRDLIGTGGYTAAHYDFLTRPWRQVIGPVHPDDPPLP